MLKATSQAMQLMVQLQLPLKAKIATGAKYNRL